MTIKILLTSLLFSLPLVAMGVECRYGSINSHGHCTCSIGATLTDDVCIKDCGSHGNFSIDTNVCVCEKDWTTAGITDTIAYFEGTCSQFQCKSDTQCQDLLGLSSASCPKKDWNCACGFSHMSYDHGGARCQNFLYTVSYEFTYYIYAAITVSIKYLFNPWIVLFLTLFGQKRTHCNHGPRNPMSNWFGYRRTGNHYYCQGSCVFEPPYRELSVTCIYETIRDEFAWLIFYVSTIAWTYSFLGLLWLSFFTLCSFILWVVIGLICIVIMCFFMVNGDSNSSSSCDCCCTPYGGTMSNTTTTSTGSITNNYYYYNYPYYYGNCGSCECDCCKCCSSTECCRWLSCYYVFKKLIFFFPQLPSNRKGGVVGYIIGTHPCRTTYFGGSEWKDLITGSTKVKTSHSHSTLDQFKTDVIHQTKPQIKPEYIERETTTPVINTPLITKFEKVELIKGITIIQRDSMVLIDDDLIGDSLVDYNTNNCSLCYDNTTHHFVAFECGHGCCYDCAVKIIDKQVPCPWCRNHFTIMKKGNYAPTV